MDKVEQTIYRLIRNKYERMGYSVLSQVRNKQGTDNIRIADALAISQSALRDTSFIGFEIKGSKSDFRTELANPRKADEIAQFCNKWYVVAPKGVIPVDELPEKWGLLEATKTQLRMVKKASDLPCVPPTREFVAMIIRRLENSKPLGEAYWRGRRDGKEQESKWRDESRNSDREELQRLRKVFETFKKQSGIDIWFWNDDDAKQIGEAVKLIKQGAVLPRIKNAEKTVSELLAQLGVAVRELEANPLRGSEKEAP